MEFESSYQSKSPDEDGYVSYDEQEHDVWRMLYQRQRPLLEDRACAEHLKGLSLLGLSEDKIPQLLDVNKKLSQLTGWVVKPVSALISHQEFFQLLANRSFPAATFIRRLEEIDYIKEPDMFHEIFGHCPMLTQVQFADFVQLFAEKVLQMPTEDWPLLQRLFWFTVEFGLIRTPRGLRAYGGGILSSIGETTYSLESAVPLRTEFNLTAIFRTPYRIDEMQPIYFVIDSFQQLYEMMHRDMTAVLAEVRRLGEFPPFFEVDPNNPSIHVRAC